LDALDRDRVFIDSEHTRAFARCGADPASEFRKVVRLVQPIDRFFPQATVDEIVPFRDQVVDRAARRHAFEQRPGMAEWHAAIHAAGTLLAQFLFVGVLMELEPVADPLRRRASHRQFTAIFHESGWLAHAATSRRTLGPGRNVTRGELPPADTARA